jgi:hypothetical protein
MNPGLHAGLRSHDYFFRLPKFQRPRQLIHGENQHFWSVAEDLQLDAST